MTISDVSSLVPSASAAAWRATVPVPPDVRWNLEGRLCPIDHTPLEVGAELPGWICPRCVCWWDWRGRNGMWITQPSAVIDGQGGAASVRLPWLALAIAAALGAGAVVGLGGARRLDVPGEWVLLSTLLMAATGLIVVSLSMLVHWLDTREQTSGCGMADDILDRDCAAKEPTARISTEREAA